MLIFLGIHSIVKKISIFQKIKNQTMCWWSAAIGRGYDEKEKTMKKFRLFLLLIILVFACGCGKQKAETAESEVIESKTIYNDFIFTLTAEKVFYTEEEAGEEEPFSY